MKNLILSLTLLALSISAFSKTIYVATNGNDGNSGSLNQPYASFTKAVAQLYEGDTLIIREGRYAQILDMIRSGASGNPNTVLAYPGERVVITALEPLSGWELDAGNVYKTTINWSLGQGNFVMHEDTACDLARWPNNTDGDVFTLNSLRNSGGTGPDEIWNAYLDYDTGFPDFDWSKGGSVFFYGDKGGAGWIAWKAFIKSNSTTRLNFELNKNPNWIRTWHSPQDLGDFYLEGIREALDYQNEWYFEESTKVLYLQLPGGVQPQDSAVYMRKRTNTIKVNKNHIIVRNIEVFGGSIEVKGSYNHIYGIKSRWGNHHRGIINHSFSAGVQSILVQGTYNTIEKCDIGYGAGSGIKLSGTYNSVINNYIHNFNFLGSYDAPVMARDGNSSILRNNTVARGGRDAVHMSNNNSVMSYNNVSRSNMIADDCALFYCTSGPHNITIHHNWFHDTWGRGKLKKAAGIYLDSSPKGFKVHHNVVWNTEWSNIQMNKDARDIDIFNNTLWNGSTSIGVWHADGTHFERIVQYNNLTDQLGGLGSQADAQNNLVVDNNPFVNNEAYNWQLKSNAEAIDYGRTISGITDGYLGESPDAGAYEYGQPMWKAGIDWDPELGPDVCTESDVFEEVNGIVIIEAESVSSMGEGWEVSTDLPALGGAYLEYSGPDETEVIDSTISTWKVKISNPGTYRFLWRSRNGTTASGPDEQNSSWLNIECDAFEAVAPDSVYELGAGFANVSVNDMSDWTWESSAEYNGADSLSLYATFLYSGIYDIRLAGKASGHIIDRLTLFQDGREPFATDAEAPESYTGCDTYTVTNQWASPIQLTTENKHLVFHIDGRMEPAWLSETETIAHQSLMDGDPPSESDLSYSFRIAANDSSLYLLAYIRDDVLSEEDNLNLFLNPDNNHLPLGVYGDDGINIRLNYGKTNMLSIGNGTWKADDYEGFECTTADTAGGYILEARLPWEGLVPFEMENVENRYMGFEIQVNDGDPGPEIAHKLAWANNTGIDFSLYDTRKFGTLAIAREADPPIPVSGITIMGDTFRIDPGYIVQLTAEIEPANAANKTVTWRALDGTVVSLATSTGLARGLFVGETQIICTTQDGGYTDTALVIVGDPNPSTNSEDLQWIDPSNREISLVPNPANSYFWIKGINQLIELQVYSITGELMLHIPDPGQTKDIIIESLPAGLYMVRIQAEDGVYLKKLLKE